LTNLFRTSIAQTGGDPVTAKVMLDRSAQRVLKEYREDPQLAGKVVVTLADLYGALGDMEGQVPLLEGFLAAAGAEADRESVALAQQKLALLELHRGHLQRAAELLPNAEAVWASAPEQYREQQLEALFVRGHLLRSKGELAASIATYQTAIAGRIKFSGINHKETANLYNSLAITLAAANRTDEALSAYRTNLDIYAKLGQSEDLDALIILGNVGTLAFRNGRIREAEQSLKLAYEKQRERAGDSAAVAASMGLYGAALSALNQQAQAAGILQSAVDMAVKFAGVASPLAIQDRIFLTDALAGLGKIDAARELAAQNLALALGSLGEASLLTLRVRLSQGRVRLEGGDAFGAYSQFTELVEPLRKLGKPAQLSLAHALLGCGEALLVQAKPNEAIKPLREAVELREKLQWAQSWELALARTRLGEALKRTKEAGATELLGESAATLAAQLGEDHPQVLRARRAIGRAL
jgi:eukaryotic-like serine/threonine-protein kinase